VSRYASSDLIEAGELWAVPFDPADPVGTPSGLAPAPDGDPDPVLENLARAVQVLESRRRRRRRDPRRGAGRRARRRPVPIHGGNGADGTTNVVGWGSGWSTLDPCAGRARARAVAPRSSFAEVTGDVDTSGYRINNGTSFLLALELTPTTARGPRRSSPTATPPTARTPHTEATERFSAKDWRDVLFTEDEVAAAATSTVTVRG
jgi:acyl-homoserine-lactone acylase